MDIDEPQADQSQPCCGPSSGGDECCSPGGGQRNWRSVLFITAIVLAGAVAAHSVLTNGGRGLLPCGGGAGGSCAIDKGNGNGDGNAQACPVKAACPMEQSNGNGEGQACSEIAACPMEQGNGNGNGGGEGCCPLETQACPKAGAPGKAAGCCPSMAPADAAPQPAPGGCCPGIGS